MQALVSYSSDRQQDLISTTYGNFASQIAELFQREFQDSVLAIKFIRDDQKFRSGHAMDEQVPSYDIYRLVDETMGVVCAEIRNRMQHQIDSTNASITSALESISQSGALLSLYAILTAALPFLAASDRAPQVLLLQELTSSQEFELEDIEPSEIASADPILSATLTEAQIKVALIALEDIATQPYRSQAHSTEVRIRKEIQALLWVDRDIFDAAWSKLMKLI